MSSKPLFAKNIKHSILQHNVSSNTTISKKEIALWQYTCLTPQRINLDIQFLITPVLARKMINRITIIVTNKLTSNTFPTDGERVYYITKTNLQMNDSIQLSQGNWFIKIISPDIYQYRYVIKDRKSVV